ncbi:hypothetical protein B0H11DRAFT_2230951 [Mycena galericulata]|nr:hypothetical protein B0H11DRAFT_2230951 [Mycena galericulata]
MQADSSGLVHFVHNAPPEDHDLKRQYLALLPPQQVIDICLTLDIHVPVALKRNIWPTDFKAVIASMQNIVPKVEDTLTPIPPMASLDPTPPPQRAEDQPPKPSSEPKPPDKQPTAGPSTQPVPPLQAATVQQYGFSTQPAYPHTPYYQALPPGYAPYSYPAYPATANGFPPGAYPAAAQTFPQPPGYPQHAFYAAPSHPDSAVPVPTPVSEDTDLPSYEDMIVEGLNAVGDPEGMAPKDLFNWMAARYPVQSNFRPSASQALQKAYRRGRFEKSTGGRYRLNANWEGGNSSTRRATRRPQTSNAAPNGLHKARVPAVPFTAAPRPPLPHSVLPPMYPHASTSAAPSSQPTSTKPTPLETPKQTPPVDVPPPKPAMPPNDPYQAAENILQTINFGGLFKLEDDERRGLLPVKREAVAMSLAEHARAELQAQLALLAAQLEEIAQQEEKDAANSDVAAKREIDEDYDMEEVA